MLLRGLARVFIEKIGQIVGRQVELFGKILHVRKTGLGKQVLCEPGLKQALEFLYRVVADVCPGEKLTVVEPRTIGEKELEVAENKIVGMLIKV